MAITSNWLRWNDSTHIFEYSTDNGATYVPLPLNASVLNEGTLNPAVAPAGMPSGSIIAYGGGAAPTGFLLCNGAAVSRTTFAALFAVLGILYGPGDGSTTFNIPNLVQRFPLGKAASGTGAVLGSVGGAIDHFHTVTQTAPVTGTGAGATVASSTGTGTTGAPSATVVAQQGSPTSLPTGTHTHSVPALSIPALTVSVTSLAGNAAVNANSDVKNPPFQTVNYIVKT